MVAGILHKKALHLHRKLYTIGRTISICTIYWNIKNKVALRRPNAPGLSNLSIV
jgi:hypothetical protein